MAAWAAFRARLAELGATLLEPEWLGAIQNHHVRCAAGHDCQVRPHDVQRGQGGCRVCAGNDPMTAWAAFRARLDELGAQLLEPEWLGANRRHHVRCAEGHDRWARPHDVQQGEGICRVCTGRDPAAAEAGFRSRLAKLGAIPLYTEWRGADRKHRVRCAAGHDCWPAPGHVQQGKGICLVCVRHDPATAEANFRARLAELGATPRYTEWLGSDRPHRVRCPAGHDCQVRPASVGQGRGVCLTCAGKTWDVFYVVAHASEPRVKFGITSGDPRDRLSTHRRAGYISVFHLVTSLPGTVALDTETAVKSALTLAGEEPVHGREYFDISCLPLIIDVASGWLAGQP